MPTELKKYYVKMTVITAVIFILNLIMVCIVKG